MEYYATLCQGDEETDDITIVSTWPIGDLTPNELKFFSKKILGNYEPRGFYVTECTVERLPTNPFFDAIYLREVRQRPFEEQYAINEEIAKVTEFDLDCGNVINPSSPGAKVLIACENLAHSIREMRNDPNAVWDSPEPQEQPSQITDDDLWELLTERREVPYTLCEEAYRDYIDPKKESEIPWVKSIVLNTPDSNVDFLSKIESWGDYFLRLLWVLEQWIFERRYNYGNEYKRLERLYNDAVILSTGNLISEGHEIPSFRDVLRLLKESEYIKERKIDLWRFGMEPEKAWATEYSLTLLGRKKAEAMINSHSLAVVKHDQKETSTNPFFDGQSNGTPLAGIKSNKKESSTAPFHFSAASATNGEVIPTPFYTVGNEVEEVRPNDEPQPVVMVNSNEIINEIKGVREDIKRLNTYQSPKETTKEGTSNDLEEIRRSLPAIPQGQASNSGWFHCTEFAATVGKEVGTLKNERSQGEKTDDRLFGRSTSGHIWGKCNRNSQAFYRSPETSNRNI